MNWDKVTHDAWLDGAPLRYVDVGTGPPILLVHGFAGSWQIWMKNLAGLSREARVVAVDLPGFGRSQALSPCADLHDYGAKLAHLLRRLEIDRATVVGHSLGGLVCQRFAADSPEVVGRLALVSSGGLQFGRITRRVVRTMVAVNGLAIRRRPLQLLIANRRLRHTLLRRAFVDPSCIDDDFLRALAPGLGAPGMVNAVAAGLREDIRPALGRISCETLLLWGGQDRVLPLQVGRDLERRIAGARLEIWDGVGHGPMVEQPRRFNERIARFARG